MKIQAQIIGIEDKIIKVKVAQQRFRTGDKVYIVKNSQRSLSQNAFLWKYYTFLIEDMGLKDQGFFCPEAIHASLKARFLSEKAMSKGEWKIIEEGSSAILSKSEFSEYFEKVDHFVCDFFEISTAEFFDDYQNIYKPEWKQ